MKHPLKRSVGPNLRLYRPKDGRVGKARHCPWRPRVPRREHYSGGRDDGPNSQYPLRFLSTTTHLGVKGHLSLPPVPRDTLTVLEPV